MTTRPFSQAILAASVLLVACSFAVYSTGAFANTPHATTSPQISDVVAVPTCPNASYDTTQLPICTVEHFDMFKVNIKSPGVYINGVEEAAH